VLVVVGGLVLVGGVVVVGWLPGKVGGGIEPPPGSGNPGICEGMTHGVVGMIGGGIVVV
jgi:hypothetical protein